MAKAHSSRGRAARRTRINSSTPKPKSKPIKPTVADQVEDLDEILGRFSDALALAETAYSALETAQEDEDLIGPGVLTLKHGIDALNRVYTDLDLAILRLD